MKRLVCIFASLLIIGVGFCPECQAKIWWTCGADPVQRCEALVEFCEQTGLESEAELFRKEKEALH